MLTSDLVTSNINTCSITALRPRHYLYASVLVEFLYHLCFVVPAAWATVMLLFAYKLKFYSILVRQMRLESHCKSIIEILGSSIQPCTWHMESPKSGYEILAVPCFVWFDYRTSLDKLQVVGMTNLNFCQVSVHMYLVTIPLKCARSEKR